MIGKSEWFTPRKFGWGLGVRTKEGIVYIMVVAALIAGAANLPIPLEQRLIATFAVLGILVIDILHIMTKVYAKLDEREQKHQAAAERNAAFVAIACLVAYVGYVALTSGTLGQNAQIVSLSAIPEKLMLPVGILLAMSLAKGATLIYQEREG
ncbi:Uncharacterised protein [Candidatus Gugararchaeum adminiculabundum]|nr:Uncharacterised protein [Candidatus Gugararchaeum adminiculabundum]